MRALARVFMRDLVAYRAQFAAVTLLVVLGISLFAAVYTSFQNLKSSADYSYDRLLFGDAWFSVYQAPDTIVPFIKGLEGVAAVEGRVVQDVSLKLPFKVKDKVTCRIISMPSPLPQVNRIVIEQGSYPRTRYGGLIHEDFFFYYGLKIGDKLRVEVNGQEYDISIAGVIRTPEYLYPMKGQLDITPSTRNFAILFMPEDQAQQILGLTHSFNDISVRFLPGADSERVTKNIETILEPYGLLRTIPRRYQPSAMTIEMELMGLEQMAVMFPFLFLSVAGFTIYILLFRLVNQQKQQIGLFMALGIPARGIFLYYLSFALVVGLAGAVVGVLVGEVFSGGLTGLYADIYNLPYVEHVHHASVFAIAILLTWFALIAATYSAARMASKLPPAQAMRKEAPESARVMFSSLFTRLTSGASLISRMALRNLTRTKRRFLLTALGVSFAVLLLVVSLSFWDEVDFLMIRYFDQIQTFDLQVYFDRPLGLDAVDEIARLDGVEQAEPVLEFPCRYSHENKSVDSLAVALVPHSRLHRLHDKEDRPISVKENGIVLTETLRNALRVEAGDYITAKPLTANAEASLLKVIGFTDEMVGHAGYLTFRQAWSVLGQGEGYTSCMVAVKPDKRLAVKNYLADSPRVLYIQDQVFAKSDFKTYLKFFYTFLAFMLTFALVMGAAIVFNTTTINLWERKKEISILMVLGLSGAAIKRLVLLENTFIGVAGTAIGFPLGFWVSWLFANSYSTELMQLPFVIYPRTYVLTLFILLLLLWISQAIALRNLRHWDLVELIKERE